MSSDSKVHVGRRRVEERIREIAADLGLTAAEWRIVGWSVTAGAHELALEGGERLTVSFSDEELEALADPARGGETLRAVDARLEDAVRKLASPLARSGF